MNAINEIKTRLDIVDVVSSYVTLKKSGRNYKGLCPFHTEKTPSFTVAPERQTWRCFGACSDGGDMLSFIMRTEKIEFRDALKILSDRAGISLQEQIHKNTKEYDILYKINKETSRFYENILESDEGQMASKYLKERGLDPKTVSTFNLGMSPYGKQRLKDYLTSQGFSIEEGVNSGVLRRRDDGTIYDFFWGRLMFPIQDLQGRVVGFGGRSLDGSEPKYINTAATPIFDKRSNLYGINFAADSIRSSTVAIVVEGYMDTIAAHQHNHLNVVACMGTALTEQQVRQLRGMSKTVIQALDPDSAGQEATLRSLESTHQALEQRHLGQKAELTLRVASLPIGRDPDTLIREDISEWERVILEAVPYMEFLIPAYSARYDLDTPEGKAQAAEALIPAITGNGNPFEQEHNVSLLATTLGVTRETLEASIGKLGSHKRTRSRTNPNYARSKTTTVSPFINNREDFLEDYLVALLIRHPHLAEDASELTPEQFRRTENREVFTSWQTCNTMDELRVELDSALHEHLEYLVAVKLGPLDKLTAVNALKQCLMRLEEKLIKDQQEGLLSTDDTSVPPPKEHEKPIVNANSRLRELFTKQNKSAY